MRSAPPFFALTSARRGLLVALAVVLAVHLMLLGGLRWKPVDTEPTDPPAMRTRVLAPVLASAPSVPTTSAPPARHPPPPPLASMATAVTQAHATGSDTPAPPPAVDAAPVAMADSPSQAITETPAATPEPPAHYAFPPPVLLSYDVAYVSPSEHQVASAELLWQHDGASYQASLRVTKFRILMRQWTSRGALTQDGLAPARFGDKGFRRSETAAHFVREERKVVFSANTPEVPLLPGAQDQLSVFMQLASLWAGAPQSFAAGDSTGFQAIGARQAETWTFMVSPEESLTLPGGPLQAIKLTREPTGEYSTRAELWLAPQLAYLPARIRLTEGRDNVLDMVWTGSQPPP